MTKSTVFLAAILLPGPAMAGLALPLRGVAPELLACVLVTLAALMLAYVAVRRSVNLDERAQALQSQLAAEREARSHADQVLAEHHDVLCRLVRRQEGVREGERCRIARELNAELGTRLASLRAALARLETQLHVDAPPQLAHQFGDALAKVDVAIAAMRALAGGLRPIGEHEGLRHALERVLQDHARLCGLRYRFEAGCDPSAPCAHGRGAKLAVFRVLQEVLAGAARTQGGELHIRLAEGADRLTLEIDGGAAAMTEPLPEDLRDRLRAHDARLEISGPAPGRKRMVLSIPAQELADTA